MNKFENVNYISMGQDCSPASALKNLDLRKFSSPFDWIVSNIEGVKKCINEDFKNFHKNLKFNHNRTRVIDSYGFEFPHDYPGENNDEIKDDDIHGENKIRLDWEKFTPEILEKYERRIKRFINLMNIPEPIIIFYTGKLSNVYELRKLFYEKYNKHNIYFVTCSEGRSLDTTVITCNPHIKIWNDKEIWKKSLEVLLSIN
jgi:hypothetical protein